MEEQGREGRVKPAMSKKGDVFDKQSGIEPVTGELVTDLRSMIAEGRAAVAATVNAGLSVLYWQVGKRIHEEILKQGRAEYGQKILQTLSAKLRTEFGKGWSERNLDNMVRFAVVLPDFEISHALSAKLSWTHFRKLIYIEDGLKRDFYIEMCRVEGWSTRTLNRKINSMLYERTALSKKPKELIQAELEALRTEDRMTPDLVLKDPYVLDFLGLQDRYFERDLEDAILREMEHFLLELGAGFTFIARQKRIQIDSDDFYLDLLFYNRKLCRLMVVDLKLGSFKAEFKGQMELYLRWLDRYEREPGEEPPLGLILCADKKKEQIELLELDQSGIHVAEYLTALPPREVFQEKLKAAIEMSRMRLAELDVKI